MIKMASVHDLEYTITGVSSTLCRHRLMKYVELLVGVDIERHGSETVRLVKGGVGWLQELVRGMLSEEVGESARTLGMSLVLRSPEEAALLLRK